MAIKEIAAVRVYYHATLESSLPSIKKHGLDPSKGQRQWDPEYYLGDRKKSIFLSPSREDAIGYVNNARDSLLQKWTILRVKVDADKVVRDGQSHGDFRYVGVIPPKAIEVDETRTAKEWIKIWQSNLIR